MQATDANLSWPLHEAVSYIRTGTPGPIAEFKSGFVSFKILSNVFKIFINYLETWSQVCGDWPCFVCGRQCFIVLMIN